MRRLSGITVRYGLREALTDIDIEVKQGELITLVGANGAGKTTCLRTISGLLRPAAGRLEFLGQDVVGKAPHQLLALGMAHVPEGRLLFPEMTVLEHLELGAMRAARGATRRALPRRDPARRAASTSPCSRSTTRRGSV